MEKLKVSTAQFEHKSGDKHYNLSVIDQLCAKAAADGSQVVAFHECSMTGYTYARHLDRQQMLDLAEDLPTGESIAALTTIAARYNLAIGAGLFEKDAAGKLYKAYVVVTENGMVARHRKLHPFINSHLTPGDSYCVFDLFGWRCGILICYDNNIIENVRATKLLGADIIFMPHVTMCTPSTRPGAGFVDPALWANRVEDPTSLRIEFDGMKGREWLMKWLPSRAYDNAVYAIFSNAIGMDDDQLKNGCSMIIDPYGDVIAECRTLGNDVVTTTIAPEKLTRSGGHRYLKARRPNLYGEIISQPHTPEQKVVWLEGGE
jgi:predicted amidohydrolase